MLHWSLVDDEMMFDWCFIDGWLIVKHAMEWWFHVIQCWYHRWQMVVGSDFRRLPWILGVPEAILKGGGRWGYHDLPFGVARVCCADAWLVVDVLVMFVGACCWCWFVDHWLPMLVLQILCHMRSCLSGNHFADALSLTARQTSCWYTNEPYWFTT